jgi:hypothetical protein
MGGPGLVVQSLQFWREALVVVKAATLILGIAKGFRFSGTSNRGLGGLPCLVICGVKGLGRIRRGAKSARNAAGSVIEYLRSAGRPAANPPFAS